MKKTKLTIMSIFILLVLTLTSTTAKAALQANPNTHGKKTDYLTNWVPNIRDMEAAGGAMGLNETKNADQTPKTSNGIDVHCMRTTEYGAMEILAASGYGNPSNEKIITTTTGNNTGVYLSTSSWEWTAGGYNILSGTNARYFDAYTTSQDSAKRGDGLGSGTTVPNPGCASWHSAGNAGWVNSSYPGFLRGSSNGLFAFLFNSLNYNYCGRAVVVCGAGL